MFGICNLAYVLALLGTAFNLLVPGLSLSLPQSQGPSWGCPTIQGGPGGGPGGTGRNASTKRAGGPLNLRAAFLLCNNNVKLGGGGGGGGLQWPETPPLLTGLGRPPCTVGFHELLQKISAKRRPGCIDTVHHC
jgi:hypothetical protein